MSHGGARQGAGRKKGVPSKKTQEQIDAVEESGITPLEYLMSVFRNEGEDQSKRIDAAKAAAPYIHPKLSQVEMNANLSLDHESALDELEGEEGTDPA